MKYILTLCLMAMGSYGWAADAAPVENFTAKLFKSKGVVERLAKDTAEWKAIEAPFMLEAGDQVRTGAKGKAEIYIKYGAKVRLGPDTTFVITTVAPEGNAVEVLRGKMHAWIRKFAGRGFSVRTPSAVCAVRGTVLGVEVSEAGQTVWDLFSGSMVVSDNRNRAVEMQPNQRLNVTQAEGAAEVAPLPAEVKAPSEPSKIKEEKVEIKAEEVIMAQKAKEEAAAAAAAPAAEEPKAEATEPVAAEEPKADEVVVPVVQEPVTSIIPTQTVTEACTVSASSPDCK